MGVTSFMLSFVPSTTGPVPAACTMSQSAPDLSCTPTNPNTGGKHSSGDIAGIVIGVVVVILVLGAGGLYAYQNSDKKYSSMKSSSSDIGYAAGGGA